MAKKSSSNIKSDGSSVMETLLNKYSKTFRSFSKGDKIKGTIVSIEPNRVIVNIGGKTEGLVAEKAFKEATEYISKLKVGDEVDAMVIVPETRDGYTILSFRKAKYDTLWDKLLRLRESGDPVRVLGVGIAASGITVDVEGLSGFIPKSQLGQEVSKDIQNMVGKRFEAVVIDVVREDNKVILSEKEVSEASELAIVREAIEKVKIGEVFDGEVTNVFDFGCFVRVEIEKDKGKQKVGVEGLVHISELSWEKVRKPAEIVKPGDKVKVKIIEKTKGKLSMSIKQALKDPWEEIEKKYKKDSKVNGKITRTAEFGVFVALETGIEGLLHMTKIPHGKSYQKGDEVSVTVEEIDRKNKKISLGLVLTEKPVGYK